MYRGIGKGPDNQREGRKIYTVSCKFKPGPVPLADPRRVPYDYNTRSNIPIKAHRTSREHYKRKIFPHPSRLSTAIPNDCKNYEPLKSELDRYIWGKKSRIDYPCNNFENHEGIKEGCLFCCNWINLKGENKGHKSSPEKMVSYYVSLYKNDAEKFIRFFRKRQSNKDKKKILEGILECDFVNEEIIKYLDSCWPDLIREVGFSA